MIEHSRDEFVDRKSAALISKMSDEDIIELNNELLKSLNSKKKA